ncbi:MAG: hypothetical protein H6720_14165, partial [Sandaracinus sp.]|nr:hypothetical protein [Sandaracinus sp.]
MPFAPTEPRLMPFLRRICTRPGMFLGDERVGTLDVYLQAYGQAREDLGVAELVESEATLLDDFGRWLAATRNDTRQVRWS